MPDVEAFENNPLDPLSSLRSAGAEKPRAPVLTAALDRLAMRLVLDALSEMRVGRLRLVLPDRTVRVFGTEPTSDDAVDATIEAHSPRAFRRLLLGGDTAAAEAYADGDWDADDVVAVVTLFLANAEIFDRDTPFNRLSNRLVALRHRLRRNTRAGSRRNIRAHYDLGNDFYSTFLDPTMTYSCALFAGTEGGGFDPNEPLEEAQRRKYARVAELARLRTSDHVLEIGCGWGGFALFAARTFGCRVTGLTLSDEQAAWAKERVAAAGLSSLVDVRLQDYRALAQGTERFDKLVSIEMLEAVGHEYLPTFFAACDRLLAPHGVAVLQSITIPDSRHDRLLRRPDFIKTHIFPGSHIPSITAICQAMTKGSRLFIDRIEEIGPHYAETLRRWRGSFRSARERLRKEGRSERFLRLWDYYLAYCEGGFRSRAINDVHLRLVRERNLWLYA